MSYIFVETLKAYCLYIHGGEGDMCVWVCVCGNWCFVLSQQLALSLWLWIFYLFILNVLFNPCLMLLY